MTERRNPGCAFGPCNDSAQVGGPGCHLCDVIAMLPQRGRGAVVEDVPEGGISEDVVLTLQKEDDTTKKAKKATAPRSKTTTRKQSGRLFE